MDIIDIAMAKKLAGGGGGGIENVELVVTNGRTSDSINLVDYFEQGYPSIIDNTLKVVYTEADIAAHESYTLNIALSSVPTVIILADWDNVNTSGNITATHDEEAEIYILSITGDCAITLEPNG